ncbi:MAG: adenylosuccinate synthase [Chloroflexi bacterium]|nr:adenylosuccinate synthase [Chloroflexota bacterium]
MLVGQGAHVTVVIGCGWGDEGKGKVVDALAAASGAALAIRFNGGPNAGHTVMPEGTGGRAFKLHQVPSGIFTAGCTCLIGPGTVVDPDKLLAELTELEDAGIDTSQVVVSDRAHLILPAHREHDKLLEAARGRWALGTTLSGVGPAYEDKAARIGLRAGDLLDVAHLRDYLPWLAAEQSRRLAVYGGPPVDAAGLHTRCREWAARLGGRIVDGTRLVGETLRRDRPLILEGQIGAARDLDWGIYPYVTSSGATAGAAAAGSGVPPRAITSVTGVVKAFASAVGTGPFITEVSGDAAERLREFGNEGEREYGATTGRRRSCGWFDAVAARTAVALNGCTALALTKVDALDGLPELQVATAYEHDGRQWDTLPSNARRLAQARPVYKRLPGWSEISRELQVWEALPSNAQAYVQRIEELVGVPVAYVGTGPGPEALIIREGDGPARRQGEAGRPCTPLQPLFWCRP